MLKEILVISQVFSSLKRVVLLCRLRLTIVFTRAILQQHVYPSIFAHIVPYPYHALVLYGCETWSLTARKYHSLNALNNKVMRT
jgi:hypothetical protein